MVDRIERVELDTDTGTNALFLDGPTEFLVKKVVEQLRLITQFTQIFGEHIDPYKRMDYAERNLPAIRIYNDGFVKEFDSWFINGDLTIDVIFPPSTRRNLLQQFQDTVSSAIVQQFRRPTFFTTLSGLVPGLNELGKRAEVDKGMGFEWGDNIVPLTQVRVNFRLDLRAWDDYLVSDDRTKDSPFERVLADLTKLVGSIQGKDDEEQTQVEIGTSQRL